MATNEIKLKITVDGKEAIATMELTEEQLKEIGLAAKKAGDDTEQGTGRMQTAFTEINQGLELAQKVLGTFTKPIMDASAMEQSRVAFEVLTGSAEIADQTISNLKERAASTPFEFRDLQDATQVLLNFGISIDEAQVLLGQLGDVSGGNAQKLQSLAIVMGQVASAGRLQGQDLLQLINAGFNPLQEISRTTGQSMASLKKQMESGAIGYDMVKQSLISATSEGGRFYQMMEKQSQTLAGRMSTVSDSIGQISTTIGQNLMPVAEGFVEMAGDISSTLIEMNPALVGVLGTIGLVTAAVVTMEATGLRAMIAGWNTWIITSARVATANLATAISTGGVTAAIRLATAAVKGFFVSLGPIGWAVIGITALATAWGLLKDSTDEATSATESYSQAVQKLNRDQVSSSISKLNKELEQSTASIERARQAWLAGGARGDYDQVLEHHLSLVKQRNELLARQGEIEGSSTKQDEKKFNYFEAVIRSAKIEKEINESILKGDLERVDVLKKEHGVLKDQLDAWEELNKLSRSGEAWDAERRAGLKDAKMIDAPTRSRPNAPKYRKTNRDYFDDARENADAQIYSQDRTLEEQIRINEEILLNHQGTEEEKLRISENITALRVEQHNLERDAWRQNVYDMQSIWYDFSSDILDKSVTGKERMQRIWEGMKLEFIQYVGAKAIAHAMGEAEMTAATNAGAVARIAAVSWEVAVTLGKKMWEIASTLWQSYLTFFSGFGPFAVPLAAAGVAASVGVVKASIKAVGFDEGGVLDPRNGPGFFEGRRVEIVAPQRKFEEVIQQDIIPRLQLAQMASTASASQ
ncbi:MAG: tape measure protein, partial [Bacteroidetes bacterium]|nr:tape measure protein [Bacteroidota bacterium]